MDDKQLFIDILPSHLIAKAEKAIKINLLDQLYEELNSEQDLMADRKWAGLSDNKEVMMAFNQFYNLSPADAEYLE